MSVPAGTVRSAGRRGDGDGQRRGDSSIRSWTVRQEAVDGTVLLVVIFEYVGPTELIPEVAVPRGTPVRTLEDLQRFVEIHSAELDEPFTFIVDQVGTLLLAPRRSEHVTAAGGRPVRAAGEIAFDRGGQVTYVSNQSVGYRPNERSWIAVASCLEEIGVDVPDGFDDVHIFRVCPRCRQVNIVKDGWFECANCGSQLPEDPPT